MAVYKVSTNIDIDSMKERLKVLEDEAMWSDIQRTYGNEVYIQLDYAVSILQYLVGLAEKERELLTTSSTDSD